MLFLSSIFKIYVFWSQTNAYLCSSTDRLLGTSRRPPPSGLCPLWIVISFNDMPLANILKQVTPWQSMVVPALPSVEPMKISSTSTTVVYGTVESSSSVVVCVPGSNRNLVPETTYWAAALRIEVQSKLSAEHSATFRSVRVFTRVFFYVRVLRVFHAFYFYKSVFYNLQRVNVTVVPDWIRTVGGTRPANITSWAM